MNGPVSAFAPGKLILFGEHAVVHGQPAIAAAVDLGTRVQIEAVDGPSRILEAELYRFVRFQHDIVESLARAR